MRDISHLIEHLKKSVETGEPFFPQEHDIEMLERYSTLLDLISREDAIDKLRHIIPYKKYHRGEWVYLLDKNEVFKAINALPSADTVSREFYEDAVKANIRLVIENRELKEQIESAEAPPYCVLEPRPPFREPKTWHEKNSHTYICGDCGFEQAIYGNINEYNCCPRCGIYKEYVDFGGIFPQKRTPYREDGEE